MNLSTKQTESLNHLVNCSEWLCLFVKGMRSQKGLNSKEKATLRKLTDKLLTDKSSRGLTR